MERKQRHSEYRTGGWHDVMPLVDAMHVWSLSISRYKELSDLWVLHEINTYKINISHMI